jgi:hypothetical protein
VRVRLLPETRSESVGVGRARTREPRVALGPTRTQTRLNGRVVAARTREGAREDIASRIPGDALESSSVKRRRRLYPRSTKTPETRVPRA